MDFIGGALPNVMFLIGVIAIGIGLGLEFKIIEVKNGLSRGGRIGACAVGVLLVTTSIILYLRPQQAPSTAQAVAAATQAPAPSASPAQQAAPAQAATAPPTEAPTVAPTEVPTAAPTEVPTAAPTEVPTASPTAAPTATPIPTSTSTPEPTAIPTVTVPDIRGMSPKDATKALAQVGLQLGEPQPSCEELGVDAELVREVRKDRIACQSLAPDSNAPVGSTVAYALSDGKKD